MEIQGKIKQKFEKLINEGHSILNSAGWDGNRYDKHPSSVDYHRWKTEALNLLKRVCGESSEHYTQIKKFSEEKDLNTNSYYFKDCFGIVQAAFNDFQEDFLFDLKVRVRAEFIDDLLSQAEYLLAEGFYHPAASLAGAVLEDSLRKLCDTHGISYPEKTKLDSLNIELAKANVYDKLKQKEITAKADIRNNADHGHFDKFKIEDVDDMVKWIRRFCSDFIK